MTNEEQGSASDKVDELFYAALNRQPAERRAFLVAACGADTELLSEVESLIATHDQAEGFLESPAVELVAESLAEAPTRLERGQQLGPYTIVAPLGMGGMGEVYRARDTRLHRTVAIKVLPAHLSADPDRRRRFEHEARAISSLNHPHICTLYDIGQQDEVEFLVMEHVEGVTLAERLKKGSMALDQALRVALEIADALDKAHNEGLVHRDVKPGNIMLTKAGAKLLDFGLAKLRDPQPGDFLASSGKDASPTVPGTLLGTFHYMAPEQLQGKEVDARSDIFSLGAVLYEMVTGRKAFEGKNQASLIAAILEHEPAPLAQNRPEGPPLLDHVLRRCLAKDPEERWQTMKDMARTLKWIENEPQRDIPVVERLAPWKRLVWISSIVLWALIAALLAVWRLRPGPTLPEMRVEISTPPSADPVSLAISPDGRKLVFVATHEGRSRLWLRALGSVSSRPLEGTDGASCPFWSPNNGSVGFFADGKLKRVDVDSASVRILSDVAIVCGGTWNADDTILYAVPMFGPISRVSATGPPPPTRVDVTRTDPPRHSSHRFPQFLPDGRHFLYYAAGSPEARGIYVGDLNGTEPRRLLDADTAAVYSSGHLLFVRQGTLFAQAFDPAGMVLTGNPFSVEEHVAFDPTKYAAAVSASSTGIVIYRPGSAAGRRQFFWLDRSGKEIGRVGDPDSAGPVDPSLSPDGHRVALHRTVNGRPDIWLLETGRAALIRFTSEEITGAGSGAIRPIWSPDGTQIVFASIAKKVTDLFRISVRGGKAELLLETDQPKAATDWSTDGRFLLYRSSDWKTGWDIWALPMDGGGSPGTRVQVVRTNFDETNGQLSPDGKWVAYQSNETGRFEIYVQPFPGPGAKSAISRNGGAQVRWRRDGKELFYVGPDDRLMAVPMQLASNGQSIEIGAPTPLFTTHIGGAVQGANMQQYMVSSDGQRFLMNTIMEDALLPIIVLLNWKPNP